jgi:general secretion pathway protein M
MASNPIRDRLNRLTPRERRMMTIFAGVMGFVFLIGLPAGLEAAVISRRSEAADLRGALDAVRAARGQIRERQSKKDSIALRYAKRAPALAGFIEELAKAQKLEVTDSVDRPEVPHGKKFSERSTTIHLKKSGMLFIAKFLESIETSGYPVIVSRLDLRRRAGEPDSYDVEVGVSAYDRTGAAEKTDKNERPEATPSATSSAGDHTSP